MLWQEIDVHYRAVRQIFDFLQTGKRRHRRAPPDIDEYLFGRQNFIADCDLPRGEELCVALVHGAGFQALHPALHARPGMSGDRILASLDRLHFYSRSIL